MTISIKGEGVGNTLIVEGYTFRHKNGVFTLEGNIDISSLKYALYDEGVDFEFVDELEAKG